MKDVFRREAAVRDGVVSAWALVAAGMTRHAIANHTQGLRRVHDGVWVTGDAPITRRQLWWAAVLTAPGRALSHASAGAAYGFRPWDGGFEVVVQHGNGGPRRFGPLLVCRAKRFDATTLKGLPITTAEQTLAHLWPKLNDQQRRKMLREALRLRTTTAAAIAAGPGPSSLRQVSLRYQRLQLHRCKSDETPGEPARRRTSAGPTAG
ncbi:MAG TPA: hypothetical protein VFZ89_19360 [Solirubrobacteraceae bacterium]